MYKIQTYMKTTCMLLFILFLYAPIFAQGVFRNQTSSALEKVVQDYPSHFKNIRGELLASVQGSSQYKSNVSIPGALSTSITQSAAASKQLLSWESVVFAGTDFNTVKTHFEELFNQIKNTIIKPTGEKAVIVNGMYMDPSEDKTFTTIQFDLLPASGMMQKLNIDLAMRSVGKEWKIVLSVYDKDRSEPGNMLVK